MNILVYEIVQFSNNKLNVLQQNVIYRTQIKSNQTDQNIINQYINNSNLNIINRINELDKPNDIKECYQVQDNKTGLCYVLGYRIESYET